MAHDWFLVRADKELGPLTTQQIKEMAADGRLSPADLVRRTGMAAAVRAGSVKGLYPSPPPLPTAKANGVKQPSSFAGRKFLVSLAQLTLFAVALSGLGGAIADFCTPFFPWTRTLCVGSACITLLLLMYVAFRGQGLGLASYCLLLVATGFGVWWFLAESKSSKTRGFLAAHVRPIADLQVSWLSDKVHLDDLPSPDTAPQPEIRPDRTAAPPERPADHRELIAEIERHAPAIPDFPESDYQYDYSKDDYDRIPARAKKETRTRTIQSRDAAINGKPETVEGYVDESGKFIEHGTFTVWTDDKKTAKYREGRMLDGKRHGLVTTYFPDGKKLGELTWVHGKTHGIEHDWHKNGRLFFEAHHVQGAMHGWQRQWHDNGVLEEENVWLRGKAQGVALRWFKDGRLASVSCYRDGKRHGRVWSQDEDGSPGESGEWEDARPIGKCRFCFVGPNQKRYYIAVSDEEWAGGTSAEFIARMCYFSMKDRPDVKLQFDPKMKIGTYFSKSAAEFFDRFGRPSEDVFDIAKAPTGAPAFLRDRFRVWSYACHDGVLTLHTQPTQAGDLMVTAHWRDNPVDGGQRPGP